MYENNPQTIGDLKTAITARIRAVPRRNVLVSLTISRAACKCARNAEWIIFRENIKVGPFDLQMRSFVE